MATTRQRLARIAAPLALLGAVTLAVLLVRAALNAEPAEDVSATTAVTATDTPTGTPTGTLTVPTSTEGAQFYTIRPGDTLETVAARYGTSVESLLALNPGIDPVQLTVGQKIRVA